MCGLGMMRWWIDIFHCDPASWSGVVFKLGLNSKSKGWISVKFGVNIDISTGNACRESGVLGFWGFFFYFILMGFGYCHSLVHHSVLLSPHTHKLIQMITLNCCSPPTIKPCIYTPAPHSSNCSQPCLFLTCTAVYSFSPDGAVQQKQQGKMEELLVNSFQATHDLEAKLVSMSWDLSVTVAFAFRKSHLIIVKCCYKCNLSFSPNSEHPFLHVLLFCILIVSYLVMKLNHAGVSIVIATTIN